ncbi:MAG: thiamine pyrophosphate-dependent dehydrogenase E1 component subunit alpha [Chloroflexi bacterium]|nr:thiamine pyrophosphate-dependent dehydrogenase E1 component subunit alpha [Chloroflexota bacterium]
MSDQATDNEQLTTNNGQPGTGNDRPEADYRLSATYRLSSATYHLPSSTYHLPTLYRQLYAIRRFEETVLENFPRGVFSGTTHTSLGQEADAVGVIAPLTENDIVFSNHRCHGHFLAYGGSARALFAEMMGKATGVCGGRGGSQHLHWRNFYSNGVQGGILPVAAGMALAEKRKGSSALTVAFLGDGTLGEGALYEALNLASLWRAPILFVLENNRIAQTTPAESAIAGSLPARFQAFGIPTEELDSSDVLAILPLAGELLAQVRAQSAPRALILHTCRFGPHSKGDDTRDPGEVEQMRQRRDPLRIHAARLEAAERQAIEHTVDEEIAAAFAAALDDPYPSLKSSI